MLAALSLSAATACQPARAAGCESYFVTGYSRHDGGWYTADGTYIYTDEPIAAGSYNLPLGTYVAVEGLGVYRIADRGHLGARHIDIATWSRQEAYDLTGYYCVEVVEP